MLTAICHVDFFFFFFFFTDDIFFLKTLQRYFGHGHIQLMQGLKQDLNTGGKLDADPYFNFSLQQYMD